MKKKPISTETTNCFKEIDTMTVDRITADLFKNMKPREFRLFRIRLTKEEIECCKTTPEIKIKG